MRIVVPHILLEQLLFQFIYPSERIKKQSPYSVTNTQGWKPLGIGRKYTQ